MDINKIIARAKAILLTPRTEWPVIATETDSIAGLYSGYIVVMAAIPAVAGFISSSLVGISVPFLGSYRVGIGTGVTLAVVHYVLSLVGIFVVTLIVEALAPTFGGQKDRVQALKAVAYSYTASWVASIIGIIPGLRLLAALAGLFYGLYLLYLGLPATMKCPQEKSTGYTVVTVIAAIVVYFVLALLLRPLAGAYAPGFGHTVGSFTRHPGSGDTFASGSTGAALQQWARSMQEASKQSDAGQKSGDTGAQAQAAGAMVGAALGGAAAALNGGAKVQSLAPDRIRAFLPDTLNGLKRTEASAEQNAALGMQISKASATYSDGASHSLKLEVSDVGSLKGLVNLALGWSGTQQDKETDTGYEKTYQAGDQLVHEQWDKTSQSGEYGVLIANRFSVDVKGNGGSIEDLKQAAASVNMSGLAALKNEGVGAQ